MLISGTHFNYYFICHRKLWLFDRGIHMEQESELVYDGRLLHEYSYPQRSASFQEIEIAGIKIDYYDPKNKIIHEIKRSQKYEEAHLWQLKYYIYVLEQQGIEGVSGVLEYPAVRKTETCYLSAPDRIQIAEFCEDISRILQNDCCPAHLPFSRCKNCSYFDFCWSGENEDES